MRAKCCRVTGCKQPEQVKHLCKLHYMRQWRNGHTELKTPPLEIFNSDGYVMVYVPGHPLATSATARVYKQRQVFYDANPGLKRIFRCHVCGGKVGWDTMHIDHLDDDITNNDISNLAPAHPVCNQSRGYQKIRDTWRRKCGVTINGVTKTLNQWAKHTNKSRTCIKFRLTQGWNVRDAVMVPSRKYHA